MPKRIYALVLSVSFLSFCPALPARAAARPAAAATQPAQETKPGWKKFGGKEAGGKARPAPAPGTTSRPAPEARERETGEETPAAAGQKSLPREEEPAAKPAASAHAAEPAHPAKEALKPGWHRFGDEKSSQRKKVKVEKQQKKPEPAKHETPRKEKPGKPN